MRVDHARRVGACAKGLKTAVVKMYGEEIWRTFVKQGYPVSKLGEVRHPDVIKAVQLAIEDYESGR